MERFNAVTSAVFDVLLAPLGEEHAWFDLVFWSVAGGIVALIVYKYVSNQRGIQRAKNAIKVHLLEIRLFKEDIAQVLGATAKILLKNGLYLGHNMLPLLVMIVPMMTILFQLEAHYAFDPLPVGSVNLLTLKLDTSRPGVPDTATGLAEAVRLEMPAGLSLDAPPVRTADGRVVWRFRAERPGDYIVPIQVGDELVEKRIAVGGPPRKVPVLRTKTLEGFLYPGEPALPGDSAVESVRLRYPDRDLGWLPGGEMGVLATFFGLSILSGFALKGVFGVTL
ncbi:MAG: hypothetical protein JRS35_17400 [Deltaproteobacteria bacterium]|nr:hypothetical protein [Deltaproteobacteria bacterium]